MDTIHIPTVLTRPLDEWEMILRESEERLDAELRTDDRAYIIGILNSDACIHFEPSEAIAHAELMAVLPDAIPELTKVPEMECARWSHIAHQLFVTVGWFPDCVVEQSYHTGALPHCITLSRRAFGHLAAMQDEQKKQSLYGRFRDDFMRYIDLLLCASEVSHHRALTPKVLRRLALSGSKYAHVRLSA